MSESSPTNSQLHNLPHQDREKGLKLRLTSRTVKVIAFSIFIVYLVFILIVLRDLNVLSIGRSGGRAAFLSAFVVIIPVVYCLLFVVRRFTKLLDDLGERHLAPLGDQVLKYDTRAPILFLRSFADDRIMSMEEREMAMLLNKDWGPVIAIGKPGDELPPLGASRLYVADEDWQKVVGDLIQKAALVILLAGRTAGLAWEFMHCRGLVDPRRLILLVPHNQFAYEAFRLSVETESGTRLPSYPSERLGIGAGRWLGIIRFDAEWRGSLQQFPRPKGWPLTHLELGSRGGVLRLQFQRLLAPLGSELQLGSSLEGQSEAPNVLGILFKVIVFSIGLLLNIVAVWAWLMMPQ